MALDRACEELCYHDLTGTIESMEEWKEWCMKGD